MISLPAIWPRDWKHHKVQWDAWKCPASEVCLWAGRGSGKTMLLKMRMVRCLLVTKPWPNPRYLYVAPTREQAKRIAWEDFKAMVPQAWRQGDPHESELYIATVWGSRLYVGGMDKPARYEGLQWDGIGSDESSDQKSGIAKTILPMLTHRSGWWWRTGVPKRQGSGAVEFRRACEQAAKEGRGFSWPSADILSPEKLRWAMDHLDIKDYNEQFNAKWETSSGRIFHAFNRDNNCRPCHYHPELPIVVGSDFNVDPMAWGLGHIHEQNGFVWVEWFDELWTRDTNTYEVLDLLYAKYSTHRAGFQFFGDATARARKTSAKETDYIIIHNDPRFTTLGRSVHYLEGNPACIERWAACNAMFCSASRVMRMFVDDARCPHLVEDLENRSYKPGTREADDHHKDMGHISDAIGYPVHLMFPVEPIMDLPSASITVRREK